MSSRRNLYTSNADGNCSYDVDWTAKVEATNLKPMTKYFYRFEKYATMLLPHGEVLSDNRKQLRW